MQETGVAAAPACHEAAAAPAARGNGVGPEGVCHGVSQPCAGCQSAPHAGAAGGSGPHFAPLRRAPAPHSASHPTGAAE